MHPIVQDRDSQTMYARHLFSSEHFFMIPFLYLGDGIIKNVFWSPHPVIKLKDFKMINDIKKIDMLVTSNFACAMMLREDQV